MDIELVTTGTLLWPSIGWDVPFLFGVPQTAVLSYVDPIIPLPMNACISNSISLDDVFFGNRMFYHPSDADCQYLMYIEYSVLSIDARDIALLALFATYIGNQHEWSNELALQTEEDDVSVSSSQLESNPVNTPHEAVFVSLMRECTKEVNSAQKLQSDMVRHCYTFSKHRDSFIHSPLVGRDETTNKGILLTNAALLENIGLLVKEEKGCFLLGPNAKKRTVFMYGDALSVDFHSQLYDIIFQKITQLGNEEYVRTLLDAQSVVIMQKGHFHLQMHQLSVI
jgi:hypothetical protein